MKVTFLGTGTSQGVPVIGCQCASCKSVDPKDDRLRCSIHIEVNDVHLVVDTGPDFRYQMLRAEIEKLDAILITHEHNDHIIGLDDIRAFNFIHRTDIPLFAESRVINELKSRFHYVFNDNSYPGIPKVTPHEIKASEPFSIKGVDIMPIQVMHGSLPVMGFRIGMFTYITDANFINDQAQELIKGSEVLVLNALRHKEHHSHFSVDQAVAMANKLGVSKTYLTHISHKMGLSKEWESELPPGVFGAFDGLSFDIGPA